MEGSRSIASQICRLLAGGSRELPRASCLPKASFRTEPIKHAAIELHNRGAVPGSRLLPAHRTAKLQSGSPPGLAAIVSYRSLRFALDAVVPGGHVVQIDEIGIGRGGIGIFPLRHC
jgi:hypothetical protein